MFQLSLQLFHYQQRAYLPVEGIFRKRIEWAGDVMGGDASIIIKEVKFIYNGTYICQVKNPPDVHGPVGEIRLRVVLSGMGWRSSRLLAALRFCQRTHPNVENYSHS